MQTLKNYIILLYSRTLKDFFYIFSLYLTSYTLNFFFEIYIFLKLKLDFFALYKFK